jgi:hypothetical protein
MNPQLKVRCTSCNATEQVTEDKAKEAAEMGCYFSSCCHAVAVAVEVAAKLNQGRRPPKKVTHGRRR